MSNAKILISNFILEKIIHGPKKMFIRLPIMVKKELKNWI